ncbi:acidic leucine-rich nuclear phosphoprotein 32 family member B isoform X2 [Oryctolagus cuniculus]|uniref:acidic leucine-rich nuclear phosphoprotein 32 family member B isoform X2 n=1 Tax=Oryctolagus cuniculus TaxID=9986 RepID=UPI00048D2581|nr:retrotransposon-like protein 1 isoform X2 [Oryctolagus cuniculus]
MAPTGSSVEEPVQPPENQNQAGGEGGPDSLSFEVGVAPDDWAITLTGSTVPMVFHGVVQAFWEEEEEGEEAWPEVEEYRNVHLDDEEVEEEIEDLEGEYKGENGEEEENVETVNEEDSQEEQVNESNVGEEETFRKEEDDQEVFSIPRDEEAQEVGPNKKKEGESSSSEEGPENDQDKA